MTSNVTKEGILVLPGQVWVDLDPRMHNRKITITSVKDGMAEYQGIRRGKLSINRMYRHHPGWSLFKQAEGAMPVAEEQTQYCVRNKGTADYLSSWSMIYGPYKEALFFKEHELALLKENTRIYDKMDTWEIVTVKVRVEPVGVLYW